MRKDTMKLRKLLKSMAMAALAALLGLQAASAFAGAPGAPADREQELLMLIESLKQRVEQLEAKSGVLEDVAEDAAKTSIRQTALESKIEKLSAEPASAGGPLDFRMYWKEGIRFDTNDGNFKFKLGGRIMNDWAWYDQDRGAGFIGGNLQDGTEFRRARLYVEGLIYGNTEFKAQYDFAGDGTADFKDVYIEQTNIPVLGNLRIGHFYEPFGLEVQTSSKYITFMERALPTAFIPDRQTGAMVYRGFMEDRINGALGVFRSADAFGNDSMDGHYAVTGRVWGTPVNMDGGKKLLHLGAAYTHRNEDSGVRFRERPESHVTGVRFVDTGSIPTDDLDVWGLEAAAVYNWFSLQGEYVSASLDPIARGLDDYDFDGAYVQASAFLTGENRKYKAGAGTFDRVKPNRNFGFGPDGGPGAWELALRWSTIDLNDNGNAWGRGRILGGEQDDITVGVNWYLNPNTRMMFNYVHADVDRDVFGSRNFFPLTRDAEANIFQTRVQIDF